MQGENRAGVSRVNLAGAGGRCPCALVGRWSDVDGVARAGKRARIYQVDDRM